MGPTTLKWIKDYLTDFGVKTFPNGSQVQVEWNGVSDKWNVTINENGTEQKFQIDASWLDDACEKMDKIMEKK